MATRNEGETVRSFLIRQHYADLREELTWTVNRLNRLCEAIQLTHAELAAYIRIQPTHMRRYVAANSFPPTVELHLTLIERSVFASTQPPVFPVLP